MEDTDQIQNRHYHMAVLLDNCIIVFGGQLLDGKTLISNRVIWTFNIYSENWRKYVIPKNRTAPRRRCAACGCAFESSVYMFGGVTGKNYEAIRPLNSSNALWKLTRTSRGEFLWHKIKPAKTMPSPSPRYGASGWEYCQNLWVFGGFCSPRAAGNYLNDYGDFYDDSTNQLLCYNSSSKTWTNPRCYGSIPIPRAFHATAQAGHKVFVFGGGSRMPTSPVLDDLLELNMHSFTWTKIETGPVSPHRRVGSTLTAISENKLVLHAGNRLIGSQINDTWIIDLCSKTWKLYHSGSDQFRHGHSAIMCLHDIIIFGGLEDWFEARVVWQPKNLQQIAVQTVYQNRNEITWNCLPQKLIAVLGL